MEAFVRPLRSGAQVMVGLVTLTALLSAPFAEIGRAAVNPPIVLATSSSALGYQHPAQDKVAYLNDGSLLVGYFDGGQGVITHATNPTTTPVSTQVQAI